MDNPLDPALSDIALSRQTAQESVADRIRQLILEGHLKPGQRILQDDFASKLGVSRTPLREALHRLESEGLITMSAHRGASVAQFSIDDLQGIYAVRIALEGHAAFLAARRATPEEVDALETQLRKMEPVLKNGNRAKLLELNRNFHLGIYKTAKEPRLFDLITNYFDLADVYRHLYVTLAPDKLVKHREILVTLRKHDAEAAERVTRGHLQETLEDLVEFFEAHPMTVRGDNSEDGKGE